MARLVGEITDGVSISKLENGADLVFDKTNTASAVLDISIGFGAADELGKKQGIAHFLEHTVLNGTKKLSKREVFGLIDGVGGDINAFTLKQATRFYVMLLGKDFARGVNVLSDCLKNAVFEEKLVDIERKIIQAEVKQAIDEPEEFVFDKFLEQIFPNEFGRNTLGTEESINGISREDLVGVFEEEYFSKNLLIGVSGNFEEEKVKEEIEGNFSWNLEKSKEKREFEVSKPKYDERFFERKTQHAHLCLGFPIMEAKDFEEFLSFKLINTMLGGGLSSRMNIELREKRGLCYSVNTMIQAEEDPGYFLVSSSTSSKNLNKMKELILKELEKMKQGEFDLKELNKAKNYVLGNELILRENSFKRTEQNLQCWQYFKKTVKESLELLQGLELNKVQDVAEKYIQTEKYGLSVLKPNARV